MSYISKDEQILIKIEKYIGKFSILYSRIKDLSGDEIEDGMDGMALTQCATNLFELASRITDDELSETLSILSSGRLAKLRNIASHDYDAVDWAIAKNICAKTLSVITPAFLKECSRKLQEAKTQTKDYTKRGY